MMRLCDLPTPCLVLDRGRLRRNLERMAAAARASGVALRVDMQAARSIDVARLAFAAAEDAGVAVRGVAVSTLAEAEYFAAHDVTDILCAAGITPDKLDQAAKLNRAGVAVLVATGDADAAAAIAAHAAAPRALLALDAGDGFGILPHDPAVPEIGRRLGALFAGVLIQGGAGVPELDLAMRRLAERGCRAEIVSAGRAEPGPLVGITELRDGAAMFDDLALTVLASVTGRRPGLLTLDAGAVALGAGGGRLLDPAAADGFGHAPVQAGWPEQASVRIDPVEALPAVGDRLRVAPHDAALSAAAHDRYFVMNGGDEVVAIWPRVGGW